MDLIWIRTTKNLLLALPRAHMEIGNALKRVRKAFLYSLKISAKRTVLINVSKKFLKWPLRFSPLFIYKQRLYIHKKLQKHFFSFYIHPHPLSLIKTYVQLNSLMLLPIFKLFLYFLYLKNHSKSVSWENTYLISKVFLS